MWRKQETLTVFYPGIAIGEGGFVLEYNTAKVHEAKLPLQICAQDILKYIFYFAKNKNTSW